jgi:hypothetical protein
MYIEVNTHATRYLTDELEAKALGVNRHLSLSKEKSRANRSTRRNAKLALADMPIS